MSVKAEHSEYKEYTAKWKRCRDAAEGQDAVHASGTLYLPRLKDQTDEDYKAYRNRTPFFNATWRTISGLTGMIFRKPAKVEVPAVTEPLLATVTDDGQTLGIFSMEVVEECLKVGRVGILVDYPVVKEEGITKADAAVLNLRPTMGLYLTESIINWKISVINNKRVLSMVVLLESVETPVDEFECQKEDRYRVLDLIEGKYRVRVFKVDDKGGSILLEEFIPTMDSAPLAFIPFYFLSADDTQVCPDDPPLIDLVDLNLSHYRTSADFEHGCHFTGLPTGYITGHTLNEGDKIYVGSQSMLVFPNENTKVGFLEFSGSGLGMLKTNLERKEAQMAILGARMLEAQKRATEAAETASIHRAGENSLLASIAKAISLGMTAALQTFSDWAGGNDVVVYELNRDFFPMPMDAQTLTALMATWQGGGISKQTLFENLKQGQIIGDAVDFETEEVRINDQMIMSPSVTSVEPPPTALPKLANEPEASPAAMPPEQVEHNAAMLQASYDQTSAVIALAEAMANVQPPVVNVPAPIINIPAPIINMPEQPAPNITVESPVVNVAPAAITVNMPEQSAAPAQSFSFPAPVGGGEKVVTFTKDKTGAIVGANISEQKGAA